MTGNLLRSLIAALRGTRHLAYQARYVSIAPFHASCAQAARYGFQGCQSLLWRF